MKLKEIVLYPDRVENIKKYIINNPKKWKDGEYYL
jgi:hypothetical protein